MRKIADSAFDSPSGIVAVQAAQQSMQAERVVYSEAELRRAIGEIAARFNADLVTGFGGGILLGGPFSIAATIVIPSRCPGLVIRAAGGFPITMRGGFAQLFDIRAGLVTIRDIFALGRPGNFAVTFARALLDADVGGPRIIDNNIEGLDRIYADSSSGNARDAQIVGNRSIDSANASHGAPIFIDSVRCRVERNLCTDGGGDSITIGTNSGDCAIIGNDLGGGDATSTASAGNNTWVGNTRVPTLTLHADDEEAANTP